MGFPALTDNAMTVLKARYLQPASDGGDQETPEQMFRRVANAVDMGEGYADNYYEMMRELKFLPNSPTLMNAGTGMGTLSACFVLPLEDTMEGIMDAAKAQAMVQKFGGGTGFSLSALRPKGDSIATTHGAACGPIAVLRHLSSVSRLVTQGGKRDGANMAVLDVSHPDIMEFIHCKETEGEIHNFNISVGITDNFMEAVQTNKEWELVNPRNGMPVRTIPAREIWDAIVRGAHRNGEPGVIFLDQVNREHAALGLERITATNPCGEQPLLPNESCNLGSINLAEFIGDNGEVAYQELERVVRLATRLLDNVIDVNVYATPEIEAATKYTRKIGLGVMGWADMLIQLGIPYDSQQASGFGAEVFSKIRQWADDESLRLADEKGAAPALRGRLKAVQRRNVCTTTVAPTGTISMIADTSSGIEPLFALGYVKKNILGTGGNAAQELRYVNKYFEAEMYDTFEPEVAEDILQRVANGTPLREIPEVPDAVARCFPTSDIIHPSDHINMQAAFQAHCDSGVSKTINLANGALEQDVANAYMFAWRGCCKGVTVYRSGSRDKEVLVRPSVPTARIDVVYPAPAMEIRYKAEVPSGAQESTFVLSELTHLEEDCDGPVIREEGCLKCYGCGVSAC